MTKHGSEVRKVTEMSSEELRELFPIILKDHDPLYKDWYETEKQLILSAVNPEDLVRISHIGSTAVEGLVAKPTVDILLEIAGNGDIAGLSDILNTMGWILMSRENDPMKRAFNKGYTPDGFSEKVYHLHVRFSGDWDELYFRDYLLAHPDTAKEYGKLKLDLWKEFEYDRDGYTEAKSEFILKYSALAKREFQDRHRL